MICPKCGNEIAEGHLYCEVCGAEIQIVPDFDLQVEESINVTLSEVADVLQKPKADSEVTKELPNPKRRKVRQEKRQSFQQQKKKFRLSVGWIVSLASAAVVITVVILLIFALQRDTEPDDRQYRKALLLFEDGDYNGCITLLRKEYDAEAPDRDVILLLADSYAALGKYDECIAILELGLNAFRKDADLTVRLLDAYLAISDTDLLARVLSSVTDPDILARYSAYLPKLPVFSLDSGEYTDADQLSITSEDHGQIYYTLDGSDPTRNSNIYSVPFVFDVGKHTIRAINVNQYGLISEPVEKTYVIRKAMLPDPVLLTPGGTYSDPETIKLEKPVGAVIYYTDDGTEPTQDSIVYNQPIPMPLREKTYRFIMIDGEGVSSQVIAATYQLRMVTLVDVPIAEQAVQYSVIVGGKAVKQSEYKSNSALSFHGANYYLVDEYSTQSANRVKTGRVFAVNVLTGEIFKADMSSVSGDYQLLPLQ